MRKTNAQKADMISKLEARIANPKWDHKKALYSAKLAELRAELTIEDIEALEASK